MSKTPWTAGPWAWVEEEADDVEWGPVWSLGPGVLLVDGSDGTPDGDEIDQANARLIAAAPDMAEFLLTVRYYISDAANGAMGPDVAEMAKGDLASLDEILSAIRGDQ